MILIVFHVKFFIINNILEIYKFLSNLYMSKNPLDLLMWADLMELIVPLNISERTNMLKIEKEIIDNIESDLKHSS